MGLLSSFGYDALNRLTNAAASSGNYSFTYTPLGQLATESGPWGNDTVTYGYTEQQRTSLSLAQPNTAPWTQNYGYDSARRLQTLASPAGNFGYDYHVGQTVSPASLIRKLTLPNHASITNSFEMGQLKSTALLNQWGGILDGSRYDYDQWGQRTNLLRQLGWITNGVFYSYDKIGQLTGAAGHEAGGAVRLHENLTYGYDAAGNLQYRTNNTLVQNFVTDSLNQISNINRSGTLTVAGTIPVVTTNVAVNGQAAQRYSDLTFASGSGFSLSGNDTFTVTAQDTYGRSATNTLPVNLPAAVSLTNDWNGNLLSDGQRSFEYDTDNQLTAVQVAGSWRTEFQYDPLFRRRIQTDKTWQAGQWASTNQTLYVYDGNLVVQERAANNQPTVTYTRGLDMSLGLQGAGGIGGLLARTDATGSLFYHADGSGNITALMNGRQDITARYLYDPFGNVLSMSGPLAGVNRYRFSSKEVHLQTGLYYYGYRFYQPNLQRWLNADPLQEAGGFNLHRFVGNDPLNSLDPLGLETYLSHEATFLGVSLPYAPAPYRLPANPYSVRDQAEAIGSLPAVGILNTLGLAGASLEWLENKTVGPNGFLALAPIGGTALEEALAGLKYLANLGRLARVGCGAVKTEVGVAEDITYLYQKVGAQGEHLKFGITKNPASRYTREELVGGRLRTIAQGERPEMLQLERQLHETLPIGSEEAQKFYIEKQIEKGLKPPPYDP